MIIPSLHDLKEKTHQFLLREQIGWRTLLHPQKVFLILLCYGYLRFFLIGGMGVLINLTLTWFFTEYVFGLKNYFDAYLIGLGANLVWNFTLYSFWSFKTKHNHLLRFAVFVLYALFITAVNAMIVRFVVHLVGVQYYLVVIAATIFFLSTLNFFVFKLSLFKEHTDTDAEVLPGAR